MSDAWRAGRWWAAALVAFAFNLFLHLPISDVFDGLARRYGFTEYDTVTRLVFLVAGLAVVLGITVIVASGFGKMVSFEHIFPTLVDKA